jgi:hypothetical protein
VHEPFVGGGDGLKAKDRRERVEELARGSGHQPPEVMGAQERTVRLQSVKPAKFGQVLVAVRAIDHAAGALVRISIGVAPGPGDLDRRDRVVGPDSDLDLARGAVMQVAPSCAGDALTGQSGALAGQRKLGGFREAGLPRAVAPDDKCQARPPSEPEAGAAAHPAEACHRDRVQEKGSPR